MTKGSTCMGKPGLYGKPNIVAGIHTLIAINKQIYLFNF